MKTILGIDRVQDFSNIFVKKRIALVTNYSGVNSRLEENIEVFLKMGYTVTKIFAPEHGLYGIADGEAFNDFIHPIYNIPVISLYGDKKKPYEEDLRDIDLLVFDIQDVGLRYYTYIYTLAYVIEAAYEYNKPMIVLDRPNPLGGELILGNRIPLELSSFVGDYELPIRYGLTIGEIGKYFIKYKNIDVEYKVIELLNYTRSTYYCDTGQLWNIPSPAIQSFETTICYSGGCFFEGTNISEGRGSSKPFQIFGSPWLDMDKVYRILKKEVNKDFAFRKRAFVPFFSKYKDEVCFGIEFIPLKKNADFISESLKLLKAIKEVHPKEFKYTSYADVERIDNLTGDSDVRKYLDGTTTLEEMLQRWEIEASQFKNYVEELRIYC